MEKLALVLAVVVLVIAERVPGLRFVKAPLVRRGFATDLVYFATGATALSVALREAAAWIASRHPLAQDLLAGLPTVLVVGSAIVLYDLGGWVTHRWLHRSDFLWRVHQVHHSSPMLDWLATFRAHVIEHALRHAASGATLLLVGFPPPAVAIAAATYAVWAMLNHANLALELRPVEGVLITPRLHRLHHVPQTTEHNFGTIFALWDRWSARLVRTSEGSPWPLGVPGRPDFPHSWRRQLGEPWRRPAPAARLPQTEIYNQA
jgi:lathosterol oxidase